MISGLIGFVIGVLFGFILTCLMAAQKSNNMTQSEFDKFMNNSLQLNDSEFRSELMNMYENYRR